MFGSTIDSDKIAEREAAGGLRQVGTGRAAVAVKAVADDAAGGGKGFFAGGEIAPFGLRGRKRDQAIERVLPGRARSVWAVPELCRAGGEPAASTATRSTSVALS